MPLTKTNHLLSLLFVVIVAMVSGTVVAQPQTTPTSAESATAVAIPQVSEQWRGFVTPYLWAMGINGGLYYGGNQLAASSLSSSSLLSSLNFGGMLDAEIHKGNFGFAMDLIYASVSGAPARAPSQYVDLGSRATINQGIYNFALTYTAHNSKDVYLDALAGLRVFNLDSTTNFNVADLGSAGKTRNATYTDPVVGIKGRWRIADSDFFIPFYVDVGGGGGTTQVTSQAYLGVGRAFDWGDVSIGVKNLYYNLKNQNITTNLNYFGGALGVTFKF